MDARETSPEIGAPADAVPLEVEPAVIESASPPPLPPMLITADMMEAEAPDPRRGRNDFERGMSYWPILTILLIAANVVVFGWQLASGSLESAESIIASGALHRDSLLNGEIWRLFTPMFLHASFDHLLGNCIMLYIMGVGLEHAVGPGRSALAYFFSGVCGSCLSVAMNPGPSVGASGAIFGITGALIVFLWRYRSTFYIRETRISIVLVIWALYTITTGFLSPAIDNFAHIGGLFGGAMIAFLARPRARVMPAESSVVSTLT